MRTFISKWLLNAMIVVPLLMLYANIHFGVAALVASVFSIAAFIIGDKFLLQITGKNNAFAALMDVVLAAVYLGGISWWYRFGLTFIQIIVIAVLIGIVEFLFHLVFLPKSKLSV